MCMGMLLHDWAILLVLSVSIYEELLMNVKKDEEKQWVELP